MSSPLFDHDLRAVRRDRAVRIGTETFLYDRAFDDCLERLADIHSTFSNVLLVGCPNPAWPDRLSPAEVRVVEAGPLMAARAGATCATLESLPFGADSFDVCICIGELETANNLPLAAAALHLVLKPGGLLLGAAAGGQSLPRLRRAMVAADAVSDQASPRVHPRIDAPGLAQLLTTVGFGSPVLDVDRVELGYRSLDDVVRDLRAMGATNVLMSRSRRPLTRAAVAAARSAFLERDERASERLEILHFAAWKAPRPG